MPQAVDTVVREGKPPISAEFNRALVEARLGVQLEDRWRASPSAWRVSTSRGS